MKLAPPKDSEEKLAFLAFLVWVALVGAAIILVIDYQIKAQILRESKKAWLGINALEREKGGPDHSTGPAPGKPGDLRTGDGTRVEMGTVAESATQNSGRGKTRGPRSAQPRAGANGTGFSGLSSPVEP